MHFGHRARDQLRRRGGQTIRAEGPDHQRTYMAQVAGDGVLKGRL